MVPIEAHLGSPLAPPSSHSLGKMFEIHFFTQLPTLDTHMVLNSWATAPLDCPKRLLRIQVRTGCPFLREAHRRPTSQENMKSNVQISWDTTYEACKDQRIQDDTVKPTPLSCVTLGFHAGSVYRPANSSDQHLKSEQETKPKKADLDLVPEFWVATDKNLFLPSILLRVPLSKNIGQRLGKQLYTF